MGRQCWCALEIRAECNCCNKCLRPDGCDLGPAGQSICAMDSETLGRASVRAFCRGYVRTSLDQGGLKQALPTSRDELVRDLAGVAEGNEIASLECDPPWRMVLGRSGSVCLDWLDGSEPELIPLPAGSWAAGAASVRDADHGKLTERPADLVLAVLKVLGLVVLFGGSFGFFVWLWAAILLTVLFPSLAQRWPSPESFAIGTIVVLLASIGLALLTSSRRDRGRAE